MHNFSKPENEQEKYSEKFCFSFLKKKNQTYFFQGVIFCNFKILRKMRNFNILYMKPKTGQSHVNIEVDAG